MARLFTNNAITTLASNIGSGTTTIAVATGTGALFPNPSGGDFFTGTLYAAGSSTGTPNEIVHVTARSGDTMTVVRGQEGTSASAWSTGDTFANFPTADFFNGTGSEQDIQAQAGNSAADTGTANAGVVTLAPVPASLTQLLYAPIRVMKSSSANTGAYTLNVNGLGARAVTANQRALAAGQLPASTIFEVFWDGAGFELLSTPDQIQNNALAQMAALTVKMNNTGSGAAPQDVTVANLLTALGFGGQQLLGNGYYKFPNGLIIQWGVGTQPDNSGQTTVTFPVAFPTAGLFTVCSPAAGPTVPTNFVGTGAPSTTGTVIWSAVSSGVASSAGVGFGYLVIGH